MTAVSAFDVLFELEQATALSDNVLLGPDETMDVSPNGDMAVLECSAGVLAIFREGGSLRRIVEHASCAPDQSLLVMSPGQGGIRFDADGQCIEKQSYGFPVFTRMALLRLAAPMAWLSTNYPWSHGAHLVSPTETRVIGRSPE